MTGEDAIKILQVAIKGYDLIDGMIKIGEKTGIDPRGAVKSLIRSIQDGLSGKTSPDVVLAEIDSLKAQLAANDAAAESDLERKFDHG